MDFNFKKAPIDYIVNNPDKMLCKYCLHFCPRQHLNNKGLCTVKEEYVETTDNCINYENANRNVKRDVYVPLMIFNKFITNETPNIYIFTGACSVFSDTIWTDNQILEKILEDKEEIEKFLNTHIGIKTSIKNNAKIPYKFLILAEVINGKVKPIFQKVEDFDKEEVIGEVVKLIKQREEK